MMRFSDLLLYRPINHKWERPQRRFHRWLQKSFLQFQNNSYIGCHQQTISNVMIIPNNIGPKSNCRRCGSNVADRNPIDALVAQIPTAHTTTPGILRTDLMFAENWIYQLRLMSPQLHHTICTYVQSVRNHILTDVLVIHTPLAMLWKTTLIQVLQMARNIHQPSIMYLRPLVQRLILIRKMFPVMPASNKRL